MNKVMIWTRELWGAYQLKATELNIKQAPWFNKGMMVDPDPPKDNHWIMRYDKFNNELIDIDSKVPMGTNDYWLLILDWEHWFTHISAERLAQMQELIIRATNFFDQRVRVMFYGLPCHKKVWTGGTVEDRLYQSVINEQGGLCISLYSRGKGADWFEDDMKASDTLLRHTQSIADGRPIVVTVQGRRIRRNGWEKISDDNLMQLFHLIRGYGGHLNLFGGLNSLHKTRAGAEDNTWPIDPAIVPTDEEFGVEQAHVLAVASKAMAAT